MKLYSLFFVVATATVLSPGPGVVMTLTNALRYGFKGTIGGIFGVAFGTLFVATISATSLGVLLATSAVAFTVLKFVGAAYLVYLGVRLWRAPPLRFMEETVHEASFGKRFIEGITLQLTNPKAIFFFMSVFPHFIDHQQGYALQFIALGPGSHIQFVGCGHSQFVCRVRQVCQTVAYFGKRRSNRKSRCRNHLC